MGLLGFLGEGMMGNVIQGLKQVSKKDRTSKAGLYWIGSANYYRIWDK